MSNIRYAVIAKNSTKIGEYYFTNFIKGAPQFNANHCLINPKLYKRKGDALKTYYKLIKYFSCGHPHISVEVRVIEETEVLD